MNNVPYPKNLTSIVNISKPVAQRRFQGEITRGKSPRSVITGLKRLGPSVC